MWLTAPSRSKVLQADLLIWLRAGADLIELTLRHLHQLSLIRNLSLRQLERLAGHGISSYTLRCVLARH